MYGAAPLKQTTKDFFAGFDLPLINYYGLSESTGPITVMFLNNYRMDVGGIAISGAHYRLLNPDSEGKGEL